MLGLYNGRNLINVREYPRVIYARHTDVNIVYQLRFDNRLKPRWVKDWILGELRVKYTRKELSWWLHPKDRNEQPIDDSWSLTRKFPVVTGPTVIGEDGNEEEYLLDYLLGI